MRILGIVLLALALVGCDKDRAAQKVKEASQAAKEAATRAARELEDATIVRQATELAKAVDTRDLAALKRVVDDLQCAEYGDIMGCYYNAFALEEKEGPDAARKYLQDELKKADASSLRGKALATLNDGFAAKGSLRTKEVAGLVFIVAMEVKYPHRGGSLAVLILGPLGMVPPNQATQPSRP